MPVTGEHVHRVPGNTALRRRVDAHQHRIEPKVRLRRGHQRYGRARRSRLALDALLHLRRIAGHEFRRDLANLVVEPERPIQRGGGPWTHSSLELADVANIAPGEPVDGLPIV